MPTHEETERQYRVLRQTLDAHTVLEERFTNRAKALQIGLLVLSVLFCATTFVPDDLYLFFSVAPQTGKTVRGIASILAFCLSLISLLMDYKSKAAGHAEAVKCWSKTMEEFRKHQPKEGSEWLPECRDPLHSAYWKADGACVKIPPSQFLRLKQSHLRKIELSRLCSRHPGSNRFLLGFILRAHGNYAALREWRKGGTLDELQPKPSSS
jgi:hypothetical protein